MADFIFDDELFRRFSKLIGLIRDATDDAERRRFAKYILDALQGESIDNGASIDDILNAADAYLPAVPPKKRTSLKKIPRAARMQLAEVLNVVWSGGDRSLYEKRMQALYDYLVAIEAIEEGTDISVVVDAVQAEVTRVEQEAEQSTEPMPEGIAAIRHPRWRPALTQMLAYYIAFLDFAENYPAFYNAVTAFRQILLDANVIDETVTLEMLEDAIEDYHFDEVELDDAEDRRAPPPSENPDAGAGGQIDEAPAAAQERLVDDQDNLTVPARFQAEYDALVELFRTTNDKKELFKAAAALLNNMVRDGVDVAHLQSPDALLAEVAVSAHWRDIAASRGAIPPLETEAEAAVPAELVNEQNAGTAEAQSEAGEERRRSAQERMQRLMDLANADASPPEQDPYQPEILTDQADINRRILRLLGEEDDFQQAVEARRGGEFDAEWQLLCNARARVDQRHRIILMDDELLWALDEVAGPRPDAEGGLPDAGEDRGSGNADAPETQRNVADMSFDEVMAMENARTSLDDEMEARRQAAQERPDYQNMSFDDVLAMENPRTSLDYRFAPDNVSETDGGTVIPVDVDDETEAPALVVDREGTLFRMQDQMESQDGRGFGNLPDSDLQSNASGSVQVLGETEMEDWEREARAGQELNPDEVPVVDQEELDPSRTNPDRDSGAFDAAMAEMDPFPTGTRPNSGEFDAAMEAMEDTASVDSFDIALEQQLEQGGAANGKAALAFLQREYGSQGS